MKFAKFALAGGLIALPLAAWAAGGGFGDGLGHGFGHGRFGDGPGHSGHGPGRLFGLIEMARELDTDRDGTVSEEEFLARHAERMAAIDADGDGQVTQQELTDFVTARVAERVAERFSQLDSDGNGVLSAEEAAAPHGERFARMDQDDDGRLTMHDLPDFGDRGHRGWGWHGGSHGRWDGSPFGPLQDWTEAAPEDADTPADAAPAE